MANNGTVQGNSKIQITAEDLKLLEATKARAERERERRAVRNQRPDVKLKTAAYQAKRNAKLRAFGAAFEYALNNNFFTDEQLKLLEKNVEQYADFNEFFSELPDEPGSGE